MKHGWEPSVRAFRPGWKRPPYGGADSEANFPRPTFCSVFPPWLNCMVPAQSRSENPLTERARLPPPP